MQRAAGSRSASVSEFAMGLQWHGLQPVGFESCLNLEKSHRLKPVPLEAKPTLCLRASGQVAPRLAALDEMLQPVASLFERVIEFLDASGIVRHLSGIQVRG